MTAFTRTKGLSIAHHIGSFNTTALDFHRSAVTKLLPWNLVGQVESERRRKLMKVGDRASSLDAVHMAPAPAPTSRGIVKQRTYPLVYSEIRFLSTTPHLLVSDCGGLFFFFCLRQLYPQEAAKCLWLYSPPSYRPAARLAKPRAFCRRTCGN